MTQILRTKVISKGDEGNRNLCMVLSECLLNVRIYWCILISLSICRRDTVHLNFFEHLLQISWNVMFWRSLWSYDNSGLRNPQTKTENVKLAVLLAERIFKLAPWIASFQRTDTLEITTFQFSNTFFVRNCFYTRLHKWPNLKSDVQNFSIITSSLLLHKHKP